MSVLLSCIISVALGFLSIWAVCFVKALRDPDVKTASELRMSVSNFRLYQKLYDEFDNVLKQYGGSYSGKAEDYFCRVIFPQIKNMNEWRRYQDYRYAKFKFEQEEYTQKMYPWLSSEKSDE